MLQIDFDKLTDLFGNCLITNAQTHSDNGDMLIGENIKEISNFYPDKTIKILP